MLLQKLAEHAASLDLPPLLYVSQAVRYVCDIRGDGTPMGAGLVDTANPDDPDARDGAARTVPSIQRSNAIKPWLFADDARYTLGYHAGSARDARLHDAYRDMVARCAQDTGEPAAAAVRAFLDKTPLQLLTLPDDFQPRARIAFRVHFPDGEVVWAHQPDAVQRWWAAQHEPEGVEGTCQVCGHVKTLSTRMDLSIERVPGARSRAALISANTAAYQSYGQEASEMAALCQACAVASHHALNTLLRETSSHVRIADTVMVFWTDTSDDGPLFGSLLTGDTSDDDVRAFLRRVWRTTSAEVPDLDVARFYALTLSGSGARVAIRDWFDVPLPQARRHLARWFERMEVIGPPGDNKRVFFGLWVLAAATERDAKDVPPPLVRQLLRSAVHGDPLPLDVLTRVVRRIHVTSQITRPQAALLRLGLATQGVEMTAGLDDRDPDPAYLCGRLLSVLDDLHYRALRIDTTIKDRFYASASTTPALVFGRLVRGAQPHLDKLSKGSPSDRAAAGAIERRIAEIMEPLREFPATLSIQQQAQFALGFYHQQMERRHGIAQATAARDSNDDHATAEENEDD